MQAFTIAPASTKGIWLIVGFVLLLLVIVFAVIALAALSARGARFEVSDEGLRLRGDVYGRLVPAHALRYETAKRVDFARDRELRPVRRTLGTGMPGYAAGWFRLANGEKALVYLTDRNRAVHIATTAGYSILLSPADPDGFVAALASAAPASR